MECSRCGARNRDASRFCRNCGSPLENATGSSGGYTVRAGITFCRECGTQHPDTGRFCRNCGTPLMQSLSPATASPVPDLPLIPAGAATPASAIPVHRSPADGILIWAGIGAGLACFFIYPYILAAIAIVLGTATVFRHNRLGTIAIAIGICGILADYSYLHFLTWYAP